MPRAVIADDHPLFRSALKQAVGTVLGEPILEAATLDQTLTCLATHHDVELVLLDLNMPGNQGLTGLTTLHSQYPDVQILIVSAEEDPAIVRRTLDFGASGYVPKSAPLEQLEQAINQVLEGEAWLPDSLAAIVAKSGCEQDVDFASRLEQLTPHQFKVLKMLADGLLNKQIAYEMQVQETTIKQHVSAILRKLGVINRTQAGVLFKQLMQDH
ncbi:response regulator transcription factor [Aliiglaciecola sp. CAU 1673]|uniref:response regulator n=1 Tax=Aliiglaciecola sp. CAU 1673 TaxID=3032595 RepID=UPI0023DC92B6|nr:response regulator transcription factor [Aliiglaciecola sp. CAU 1673]MDF2179958.1 response regulator transcription factor [Aliiglaciecola sp. CAU 1673]